MKETGIIMSGDHPKKVMDDLKTMTRRTYGLEEINQNPDDWLRSNHHVGKDFVFLLKGTGEPKRIKCPYGQVGDRLRVKETFMFNKGADYRESFVGTDLEFCLGQPPHYLYRADDTEEVHRQEQWFKWRPSIFMPRKASRITLEITGLRAERLQEITEADAEAEGLRSHIDDFQPGCSYMVEAREKFQDLWDSLNAKRGYSWTSNCWVWVIEFRRIMP